MFLCRTASEQGGHIGLMTFTTGGQIEAITWNTSQGFSTALSAFIAQNYAAGRTERVLKAWYTTLWMTGIFGTFCTLLFIFFGNEVFSIFVPEQAAYEAGSRWDAIEIKSIEAGNGLNATVEAGKEYEVTVVVDEKGLDDAIGIESVIIKREDGQDHIYEVIPLLPVSKNGNLYTFKATSGIFNAGSFKQAFRMYPKNALLPHRQDFCYVRWF